MDITNFMTWFVGQVIVIFTYTYNTLNSITFAGTSLLKVSIGILILGTLLPIIMTLPTTAVDSYSSSLKKSDKANKIKSKGGKKDDPK